MKILLANPPWVDTEDLYGIRAGSRWPHLRSRKESLEYYCFPFIMAYATSALRKAGHQATVLDCIASRMSSGEFNAHMEREKYDLIILETSTPSIEYDYRHAEAAKRTGAFVALAGQHATALPEEVLSHKYVDLTLRSEYDQAVVALADVMQAGKDFSECLGIAVRTTSGVKINAHAPLIDDLDAWPYPAREDLPIEKYIDPFCKHAPNVQMISSRGCPYDCTFCLEPTVFYGKRNYRMRSAKSVVDEMEYLVKTFGAKEIYMDDSSFSINQKRVLEICEELMTRGLKVAWSCMADAKLKRQTLEKMKIAGCDSVKFGVESADETILKNIDKPVNLEEVRRAAQLCHEVGIKSHATYSLGQLGETPTTIRKTVDFAFSLGTDTAQFSVAIPYPGTRMYDQLKERGFITATRWEQWNGRELVYEYPNLKAGELLASVKDARRKVAIKAVLDPRSAWGYAKMVKDYSGWGGLFQTAIQKSWYLMTGR